MFLFDSVWSKQTSIFLDCYFLVNKLVFLNDWWSNVCVFQILLFFSIIQNQQRIDLFVLFFLFICSCRLQWRRRRWRFFFCILIIFKSIVWWRYFSFNPWIKIHKFIMIIHSKFVYYNWFFLKWQFYLFFPFNEISTAVHSNSAVIFEFFWFFFYWNLWLHWNLLI